MNQSLARLSVPVLPAALLFGAAAAVAQGVAPSADAVSNRVSLAASASTEVQQDHLAITLVATREGGDAQAVQVQLKSVLDAALAEARAQAQPGRFEVRTGGFSLYPRYGKDGRINGWQGRAELVLEGRDLPRISATAGRITGMTVANVASSLSRDERQRVEAALQAEAIERFRARAADIARSFGFGGFVLREVTVQTSDGERPSPVSRVAAMAAYAESADAPVPVAAGRTTVTVSVSGTVQLR
jgi:predicted secreted protein